MKQSALLLTLLLLLNLTSVKAQDSISPWSAKFKAGGLYLQGNTNKFFGSAEGLITFRKGIVESILSASVTYGESDGIKDDNDLGVTYTFDLWYDNIWSPFVLQYTEYGFSRNIELRSQSGAGIKYTFVPFPNYKSSLSAAGIYDYTNYKNIEGYSDSRTFRISVRLKTKLLLFGERFLISHVTFYQPSVKEIRDRIWNSETTLGINISEIFSFNTTYKYHYEFYTVQDRKKHDHELTFGIGIELK
jgi:hypothetical protein